MSKNPSSLNHMGARLKRARERLIMTQDELSKCVGKTRKAISGYESGTRGIRIEDLPMLAECLQVPISYFFADYDHYVRHDALYDLFGLLEPPYDSQALYQMELLLQAQQEAKRQYIYTHGMNSDTEEVIRTIFARNKASPENPSNASDYLKEIIKKLQASKESKNRLDDQFDQNSIRDFDVKEYIAALRLTRDACLEEIERLTNVSNE